MFWLMKYSYHWKVLVWSKEFKLSRSNIDIVTFNDYTFDYMNDGAKVPSVIRHNFFRRILLLRKTKVFFIFLLNRYRIIWGQMLSRFATKLCFFLKLVGIDYNGQKFREMRISHYIMRNLISQNIQCKFRITVNKGLFELLEAFIGASEL